MDDKARELYEAEIRQRVLDEYKRSPPTTMGECVGIAARVSVHVNGPVADNLLWPSARGLAAGLFGPAYVAATGETRHFWDCMCADALREQSLEIFE